jgi:glycolate oxidase FAD binding subunit
VTVAGAGSGAAAAGALAAAAGAGRLLSGEAARPYAVDGVVPRFVVVPETVAGVGAVLAVAAREGLGVVAAGGLARIGWGAPPRRLDVVLSLAALDRVLAHEPADLTLSVQAGARLGPLNEALRPHRQFVPLDPAHPDASTIGGLIATGAAGPYRARYGTTRDLLLGLTVVRADGTLVKAGGKVVKNVTGYDIPKLHVGAYGTLGVVVEAHLRLHPRPAEERSWIFGFPGAEAALEAATAIRDTPVVLSRCQLLPAGALRALGEPTPPEAALAVTVGSVPEAVRDQGARIAGICGRAGSAAIEIPEADAWWRGVAALTWSPADADALALRIGTRPTDVVKALRLVEAAAPGARVIATADLGAGVLQARLEGLGPETIAGAVARVREGLRPMGGTCVIEQAPPAVKAEVDVWGDVGPALAAMRRLKAELDPAGVLSPGRFVGGI